MFQLKDSGITVTVSAHGAELQSIVDADGIERLWQADPKIWGRHAPLLFPIIGRLKDNQYVLNGEAISITTHGFARDSDFTLAEQTGNTLTLRLEDSAETRKVYPFSFTLDVTYTLKDRVLTKTHRVTNRSASPMPFEVGGHDAFRTTLLPGETMSDYYLQFEELDAVTPHLMQPGTCFVQPESETIPLQDGRWYNYREFLHRMDTAVMDRLPVNRITLGCDKNEKKIRVTYDQLAYVGIWTADKDFDTNYVCIEPWSTLPECTDVGPNLTDKKGIRIAQPGRTEELSFTVEIIG